MDWFFYIGIGALATAVGYNVVRYQAGREVQFGTFLIGVFLMGMGTYSLLVQLNDHNGLPAKLGNEPQAVRAYWMDESQICFIILETEDKGCAIRSDLVGLDWALRNTTFIGPVFEVQRLEENGVYRGVQILNPHDQQVQK